MATAITTEGTQAYAPCIFTISRDTADTLDVAIEVSNGTDNDSIYYKTIKGESAQINVADYAKAYLNTTPATATSAVLSKAGTAEGAGRTAEVRVTASGTAKSVKMREGWDNSKQTLRTTLRKRLIAVGGSDEIEVAGNVVATITVQRGNQVLATLSQSAVTSVEANIYTVRVPSGLKVGDTFFVAVGSERIDYKVVASGKQLKWVNRYGAVDSWVWESEEEEKVAVKKTRIYTASGYETLNTEAEESVTLRSRVADRDTARQLAGILYARKVWMWNGEGYERVDVENTDATVIDADNLTQVGVRTRKNKRLL